MLGTGLRISGSGSGTESDSSGGSLSLHTMLSSTPPLSTPAGHHHPATKTDKKKKKRPTEPLKKKEAQSNSLVDLPKVSPEPGLPRRNSDGGPSSVPTVRVNSKQQRSCATAANSNLSAEEFRSTSPLITTTSTSSSSSSPSSALAFSFSPSTSPASSPPTPSPLTTNHKSRKKSEREQRRQHQASLESSLDSHSSMNGGVLNGDVMLSSKEWIHESILTLNIGGKRFCTSIATLRKDQSSMLAAMFSGRYTPMKDSTGAYFIDRDGTHFRWILNYLRDGSVDLMDDLTTLKQLMREAQFYQIEGLISLIRDKMDAVSSANRPRQLKEVVHQLVHVGAPETMQNLSEKVKEGFHIDGLVCSSDRFYSLISKKYYAQ